MSKYLEKKGYKPLDKKDGFMPVWENDKGEQAIPIKENMVLYCDCKGRTYLKDIKCLE